MEKVKYPRTPHLPWSEGATKDDKIMSNVDSFIGQRVIMTEKMDGENTTIYSDGYHARSVDGRSHPSRCKIKELWETNIKWLMLDNFRICGENMYARHSIAYDNLEGWFLGFAIFQDLDGDIYCAGWSWTEMMFQAMSIPTVPIIYEGIYKDDLHDLWNPENSEGYVIRLAHSFTPSEFHKSIGKYVRAGHVQTDEHWMYKEITPNRLRNAN